MPSLAYLWNTGKLLASTTCFWLATTLPAVAQEDENRLKDSLAWGLVVLFVVLGMMVTLLPPKRDVEVKRHKE
jgi:FtsH-binding integral membrane protein